MDVSKSITANSNRAWIRKHPTKFERYLRRSHKKEDRQIVSELLYNAYPDEGRKLIENYDLPNFEKKRLLVEFLVHSPQITCGIFADQRKGKDALLMSVFEDCVKYCKEIKFCPPRFVTLGNMRNPPFVYEKDMYFSFKSLPVGSKNKEVWVYSSEIETLLPARESQGPENKLFSFLEGTMAQNHQKLFGCSKLASKVDINFIRGMNVKLFKYISPEKLRIEGVERVNILSELAYWLLPSDPQNLSQALLCFDNQLFTVNYDLPLWWNDEYSEQFRDIPIEKVWDFVDSVYDEKEFKEDKVIIAVAQKFRKQITRKELSEHFGKL